MAQKIINDEKLNRLFGNVIRIINRHLLLGDDTAFNFFFEKDIIHIKIEAILSYQFFDRK